ncbi:MULTISPECIES: hypothetical protein [Chryseobacterium]|jgi:hypothetical protein|uniref:Uncharacterized protein n=1 Tax=Chryseobacterium rhizosphaerae TaxID=395937 RepID=A0ABX9IRB4_9FLAO|nr:MULTISPECIES: hypothetical protein [Chryseobacterium]MDC8098493.1 hypothetical protein [Chryseobacterium rhizosphaerae]REC78930.1 hypothetical protein DRF57_01245 [Chryseobacterium rhizosphaerae]GEN68017.1 hypothetical protein CRH01_25850 [Chryseobacterium rhizosphaerae]SMC53037.1 hypothetical protein SAMN02787074_1786 [Chryseobacterium sp. YR221]
MLSIFILIGAYRYYAQLAERFGKTKWHFGLLAIGIYLGSQIVLGVAYGVYKGLTDPAALEDVNYTGFSLVNMIGWVISIAAVWGIYQLLEKKFMKENLQKPSIEIEKIGEVSESQQN